MGKNKLNKGVTLFGVTILIVLSFVGWAVFSAQNPLVLAKSRLLYIQAKVNNENLNNSPCLGKIDNDWVVDISHVPQKQIDEQKQNQCAEYLSKKIHHLVEMSPEGEIILVK